MNQIVPPGSAAARPEDPAASPSGGGSSARPLVAIGSPVFKDVQVALQASLGEVSLTVEILLGLRVGSVLKLDTPLNALVDLHLNGAVVARGEIVAVDDNFGVRIVEVAQIT
ncbi:MAG: FliM/FliN family flagellar motor switch protein [Caulobacteraceae bacterium]|nr:FliM/FliN family flagellar motor switch protein [Caulobacteraceae bacterium]